MQENAKNGGSAKLLSNFPRKHQLRNCCLQTIPILSLLVVIISWDRLQLTTNLTKRPCAWTSLPQVSVSMDRDVQTRIQRSSWGGLNAWKLIKWNSKKSLRIWKASSGKEWKESSPQLEFIQTQTTIPSSTRPQCASLLRPGFAHGARGAGMRTRNLSSGLVTSAKLFYLLFHNQSI